jgi:hypothetical protein
MEILRDALEKDGIGAKTAAGYGRLHVDLPPKPEPLDWRVDVGGSGNGKGGA